MKNLTLRNIVLTSTLGVFISLFFFVSLTLSQASDKSIASIDTGLIMHYPMNGSLEDISGNNRHATIDSDISWENNQALNLKGVSDYVKTPIELGTVITIGEPIHFSLWFKASPSESLQVILGGDPGSGPDFAAVVTADGFLKTRLFGGIGALSDITVNDNSWHEVSFGTNGDDSYFYIDGSLQSLAPSIGNHNRDHIALGGRPAGSNPSYFYDGLIDEVRIYNRALSQQEILQLASNIPMIQATATPIITTPTIQPTSTKPPVPTSTPTLLATPTPSTEFYSISINQGKLFTRHSKVSIHLTAPISTTYFKLSNDGSFSDSEWQTFSKEVEWELDQFFFYILPRIVYVRFKDVNNIESPVYSDDIVLDVLPPWGHGIIRSVNNNGETSDPAKSKLIINASDDVSGLQSIRFSQDKSFPSSNWQPFQEIVELETINKNEPFFIQLSDRAGNISEPILIKIEVQTFHLPAIMRN